METMLPGGARIALTTTETTLDLTMWRGKEVVFWSDDCDFFYCASATSTGNVLVTTGSQAPSATALVAERAARGTKLKRRVGRDQYLVLKAAQNPGGFLILKAAERP